MPSRRLLRLLKKSYGTEDIETHLTPELKILLEGVDVNFEQNDRLLETANRNLEANAREINERNRTLERFNQNIRAMMDSLEQGFFVFDRDGVCLPIHSRACRELIETDPDGQPIADVLRIPPSEREEFAQWTQFLFDEVIDFEDLAILGPPTFPHSKDRLVVLEFKPMRGGEFGVGQDRYKDRTIEGIVVIATDRTMEREAREAAESKQLHALRVTKIASDRNLFLRFVTDVRTMVRGLREDRPKGEVFSLDNLRMLLHTIKGAASLFYIEKMHQLVDAQEWVLGEIMKSGPVTESTFRRSSRGFANEMEIALEAVLEQHRELLGADFETAGYGKQVRFDVLHAFLGELDRHPGAADLKRKFQRDILAVPLRQMLLPYDAVLRETAQSLGKQVEPLIIDSDDIRVVPDLYIEVISELVHVFRNTADHALESPEERLLLGKPGAGKVRVEIRTADSDRIRLSIFDDGRGVDPARIRGKMAEREAARIESDQETIQHIFDDGISTAASMTELSGRGVGLASLRAATARIGGTIQVFSTLGQGAEIRLTLPYRDL